VRVSRWMVAVEEAHFANDRFAQQVLALRNS
jgi:hypothetical protein